MVYMIDLEERIVAHLRLLGLTESESTVYIALCKGANTHLGLSRATGVDRSKIYRLVERLEQHGLVSRITDDRGTFLVACSLGLFEAELISEEEELRQKREAFNYLRPFFETIEKGDPSRFVVRNHVGYQGCRQMLWNELKGSKQEVFVFGNILCEQLSGSRRWAEKHRALGADQGNTIQELINTQYDDPNFTKNERFLRGYSSRLVPSGQLPIAVPMMVYGDTVAIYQLKGMQPVGVEIVNAAFADTMRHMFHQYWQMAGKPS
jgi:DNA-binding MarR family transcriptional regulator